jgi:hypothetical protein
MGERLRREPAAVDLERVWLEASGEKNYMTSRPLYMVAGQSSPSITFSAGARMMQTSEDGMPV